MHAQWETLNHIYRNYPHNNIRFFVVKVLLITNIENFIYILFQNDQQCSQKLAFVIISDTLTL